MFDHTVKKVMQFFISTSYSLKYNKYNINDIKTIEWIAQNLNVICVQMCMGGEE